MPSTPGMFVFPNSAPDSFTPKNLNLVRLPEQTLLLDDGAVDVVDATVLVDCTVVVATLGWHCE